MKHRLSLLLVIVFCSILSVGYSVNNGVFLDGAGDYVSIPTTTRLDSGMSGASGLTVEAWINPTTLRTGGDTYRNLIVNFCTQLPEYPMVKFYLRDNGKLVFGGRSKASEVYQDTVTDDVLISTGSWQHVAGVLDFVNKTIKIYVNGELKHTRTGVPFVNTEFERGNGGTQHIGINALLSTNQYFHGTIDDMRLWRVARTAEQISFYMDKVVPPQTELLAYWKFDEEQGRIAYDSSNSNIPYNGDLQGGAYFTAGNPTLPVELSSFTATISTHNNVVLTWVTQSETGVMGFYVFRGTDPNLANAQQISSLIDATNTADQKVYVYTDNEINQIGTYYYWLMVADINGSESYHGPIHVTYENTQPGLPNIPVFTELKSVYPNPFNPNTTISYVLAQPSDVLITIFNMRGQEVRSFERSNVAAGPQNLAWDGKDQKGSSLASGVYYIRMQTGADSFFKKAVLMK